MKNETPVVTVPSRSCLRFAPVLAIAALMAFCPTLTRADTIAFSISGGQLRFASADVTLGYAFTLSTAVTVTNLGLFDFDNNGLAQSHTVTIWTDTGTQEVQATIPAGTGTTLIDGFRYVSISPFTLAAGNYTIAGFYTSGSSDFVQSQTSITGASGVSYVDSRAAFGFVFPTGNIENLPNSYFGPNFQFTVPTPDSGSTVSLLSFALLGVAVLRRKLRC